MKNLAPKIKSNLDTNSEEFSQNKEMMLDKISFLDELLHKAKLGGGTHHHESCLLYTSPSPRDRG